MSQRAWIGVELLAEIFSLIYSRRTGISKRITKAEAVDIAVEKTIKDTLAELKKVSEK